MKFYVDSKIFFLFIILSGKRIKNYSPIMCRHLTKQNGRKCLVCWSQLRDPYKLRTIRFSRHHWSKFSSQWPNLVQINSTCRYHGLYFHQSTSGSDSVEEDEPRKIESDIGVHMHSYILLNILKLGFSLQLFICNHK